MNDRITLTKKTIEAVPLPEKGRAFLYDAKVPGLAVQVTAAGARSFQVYRWANGKPVRVTLGRYPDMSIEQARRAAQAAVSKLAEGTNPNHEKRAERVKAITLREALDGYITARKSLKPRTVKDMRLSFGEVFTDWLDKPLTAITRDMVDRRHRAFGEGRSKARANLGMRYLRTVVNWAMDRHTDGDGNPLLTVNPVGVLKRSWYRIERRRTVIKPHEIKPWWEAVEALPNRVMADYFQLVLLTGLRREEALALTWDHVDLQGRTLTVRDPKNRQDHTLPLSGYLLAMLARRKASATSGYVFADTQGRRIGNFRYAQDAIKKASGVAFCIHDLRRTFATIADSLDIPGYALKALLNHKTGGDVTAGYVVVTPERLREPMQKITDYVLKAAGLKESAHVLPFQRTAG